mmetsp:Transcript_14302/g.20576  ORF Transcript_14302/g.20576 Transcript_14302/m.20576 type:complete len:93 (+) Transcript_14302:310-588(+)
MSSIIKGDDSLMNSLTGPDTVTQFVYLSDEREALSGRKGGSVRYGLELFGQTVTHPERPVLCSGAFFESTFGQQPPRQRSFVDPVQGSGFSA